MADNDEIKTESVPETEETTAETEETPVKTEEITAEAAEKADEKQEKPKKKRSNPFKSKKFRHGSLSVVFTVMFIAGVVLINVVLGLVLERFSVEADLTAGSIFTLGAETEDYIRSVNDDVTFYVTTEKDTLKNAGSVYE